MGPIYFEDSMGYLLTPIWFEKDNVLYCSVLATSDAVAPRLMEFIHDPPKLLPSSTPLTILDALDFTKHATWYRPDEHWLGWIPKTTTLADSPFENLVEDPLAICFEETVVERTAEYENTEVSDRTERTFRGFFLDEHQVEDIYGLCSRISLIGEHLAKNCGFYRRGRSSGELGDMPVDTDLEVLHNGFRLDEHAQNAFQSVRRSLLSLVGFLAWFLSVIDLDHTDLSDLDKLFVTELRLEERPKMGSVYRLHTDYHEFNFPHLIQNGIGFHYTWTKKERGNARFLRYSPEYYNDVRVLRDAQAGPAVVVENLASYRSWKGDLGTFDWMMQNVRAGKVGGYVKSFNPKMEFYIIDRQQYGARLLFHQNHIRAYAHRFNAVLGTNNRRTVCTFIRNIPLHRDDEPKKRPIPKIRGFPEDFSSVDYAPFPSEDHFYYESNYVAMEQAKNLWAPREGRTFSSYNGRIADAGMPTGSTSGIRSHLPRGPKAPSQGIRRAILDMKRLETNPPSLLERLGPVASGSPIRRARSWNREDKLVEVPEVTGDFAARKGSWSERLLLSRRASSRSASPPRRVRPGKERARSVTPPESPRSEVEEREFTEEFHSMSDNSRSAGPRRSEFAPLETHDYPHDHRSDSVSERSSSPMDTGEGINSRETLIRALVKWADGILELKPAKVPCETLNWSQSLIENSVLVCDDPRTLTRLQTIAVSLVPEIDRVEEILEYAMRFGMQFDLYIRVRELEVFRDHHVSALTINTLPAIYGSGYTDQLMSWTGNGPEAQYAIYLGQMHQLLSRLNAIAFVALGGVPKFVAEVYAPNLAHQFALGPGYQVTEFARGNMKRLVVSGVPDIYTAVSVSAIETAMVLGHTKGKTLAEERSLSPSTALLEDAKLTSGFLSTNAYGLLEYLRKKIIDERVYEWRTRNEWRSFLRTGVRGQWKPDYKPTPSDFEEGRRLLNSSFPAEWNYSRLTDIVLPMESNNN
ncbi:hypothetical protein C8R45DRAFT_1221549 [Mycena sanguinolenta]|nr:hypothetical protein C8R45DRAFT_1221549 [Mycena sanguinolenta]